MSGGGSGGGSTYYANQDKLLGVQADIAQGIFNNIYQPHAPGAVASLASQVKDAESGALTERARSQAGADAGMAMGQGIEATNRNMARYGINPHAFGTDNNEIVLRGAALKTGAMNKASEWGEGQKWGRTYDFYNMLSGIPSNASSSLGSVAAGYGSMGRNMQDEEMANAQGWGRMGGYIGTMMRKDGGPVKVKPVRMARGGIMKLPDWRTYSTAGSRYGTQNVKSPAQMAFDAGIQTYGANKVMTEGAGAVKGAIASANQPTSITAAPATGAPAPATAGTSTVSPVVAETAPELLAAEGASTTGAATAAGATEAGTAMLAGDAITGSTAALAGEAAATAAAGTAAGTAAAGAAGTVAATNAWNPVGWAAAVYGVGSLAGWWADGGPVERKSMTEGGNVNGPGGPTEDKVPAWLSDGEYVLNAEAVKMVGEKKLDAINEAGLKKRGDGGKKSKPNRMAMGGIFAGAMADQLMRGEEFNERRKARAEDVAWRESQAAENTRRWGVQDARQQVEVDRATQERAALKGIATQYATGLKEVGDVVAGVQSGQMTKADAVSRIAPAYNEKLNDGRMLLPTEDGNYVLQSWTGQKATGVKMTPDQAFDHLASNDMRGKVMLQMFTDMATVNPAYAEKAAHMMVEQQKMFIQQQEGAENRGSHEKIASGNNATSVRVAGIHEGGANARNAASVGVAQGSLDLSRDKDKREQDRLTRQETALSDMDAAERSGDVKAYNDARRRAIASGIKLDKADTGKSDFTPNPMGMGGNVKQIQTDGSVKVTPISPDGIPGRPIIVAPASAARTDIPQEAVNMLKAKPSLAKDFDAKYGAGAAAQYLR